MRKGKRRGRRRNKDGNETKKRRRRDNQSVMIEKDETGHPTNLAPWVTVHRTFAAQL